RSARSQTPGCAHLLEHAKFFRTRSLHVTHQAQCNALALRLFRLPQHCTSSPISQPPSITQPRLCSTRSADRTELKSFLVRQKCNASDDVALPGRHRECETSRRRVPSLATFAPKFCALYRSSAWLSESRGMATLSPATTSPLLKSTIANPFD